jgi:glycosyltransferase involved in cell wall biosynthesis
MNAAVYHDYFSIRGGGERLVLELARSLDAELIYGYRTRDSYPWDEFPADHRSLQPGPTAGIRGLSSLVLVNRFASERKKAEKHRVRIFSGVVAPFAAPSRRSGSLNIFYCHTPPRFIYDQKEFFSAQSSRLRRGVNTLLIPSFQRGYERAVDRMDVIVANSENIRRRIKTHLGRDSEVVYPPVDTNGFVWEEPRGYYLSTGRLTPLKRIRTIIEAFLTMPDKRLVVASGGDQEEELRAMASGSPNIHFTGWTDDAHLRQLIAGAIATIYIPTEEDFGMSPVESMAAGKPVIAVAEGGILETVVPNSTGVLLPPKPSHLALAEAVRLMTPETAIQMREACQVRAQQFSQSRFLEGMKAVIARGVQCSV